MADMGPLALLHRRQIISQIKARPADDCEAFDRAGRGHGQPIQSKNIRATIISTNKLTTIPTYQRHVLGVIPASLLPHLHARRRDKQASRKLQSAGLLLPSAINLEEAGAVCS